MMMSPNINANTIGADIGLNIVSSPVIAAAED